ncbi:cytochrome P450 [Fennellomyces sp. T-0311]|nr:cytochrome P450 [Fennellomyces sp. T-0311]
MMAVISTLLTTFDTVTVLGITAVIIALLVVSTNQKSEAYPPYAPWRFPVVGHLPHFARGIPLQELLRRWSIVKGPVFTIQCGTKRWIILNSKEAVKQLIVDRSTTYSSRNLPDTLVNDLMDGVDKGGGFAFYPYGPSWRYLRRIAHTNLVKKKIDLYQPILDERRTTLLRNIWEASQENAKRPITLTMYIEHFTMTSILAIAFGGIGSFKPGDPKLHQAFALTERIAALLGPSEQIREFFPILQKILPSSRAEFVDVRKKMVEFYGGLLETLKTQTAVEDCFVSEVLANGSLTDLQIISFASLFIGAGSETTASTLEWMIALLANHPEVQYKVYEEIKANVGLVRLPRHEDEPDLPYLQCVILETLRLRPPAPLSVPHATSQDDTYKGWFIPAQTTVIINLHAIHQDPIQYPEPHKFIPERHMAYVQRKGRDKFSQTTEDRPHLSFSTGRRVCVGIHLAERSLFLAASGLLSCYKIDRTTEALLDVENPRHIQSPTFAPRRYQVRITPRHSNVQKLLAPVTIA